MIPRSLARRLSVVASLALLAGIGLAPAANAADLVWYKTTILSTTKTSSVNYNQVLGNCENLPCSISYTKSATRTIGLTAGLTRSGVAAELGIGSAATVSVGVRCSAAKTDGRNQLTAYAEGYKYTYKVKKQTLDMWNTVVKTEYLTLVAFNPTGARCVVHY